MQPLRVLETCLYADDLAAAESFYRDVLDLELHSRDPERYVFFRCGRQLVLVFDPQATRADSGVATTRDVPPHGAVGAGHVAFHVGEKDLAAWRQHLAENDVAIEREIDWPRGGRSIYFRDPAGNSLELVTGEIWGVEMP